MIEDAQYIQEMNTSGIVAGKMGDGLMSREGKIQK
jgi:hypothetical protein